MQKKLLLNALIVIALLTFPAASFASGSEQTTGSDMDATLTITPNDHAILAGDDVELTLHITNVGPEASLYDHDNNGLPIAEYFVPPSIDINSFDTPEGVTCFYSSVAEVTGPTIAESFPGYNLVICNLTEDTPNLSISPQSSVNFVLHGTANADIAEGTRFLGLSLSAQDPSFIDLYNAMNNGEDPFSVLNDSYNFMSETLYSIPVVTTTEAPTTEAPTTTAPAIVTDLSVTGTLSPSGEIHAGDAVTLTYVIHNSGPDTIVDTIGNQLFFELFASPELSVPTNLDGSTTAITGVDGMTCQGGLLHDIPSIANTIVDTANPGFYGFSCATPATPGLVFASGDSITITVHGTAHADFVDGVTTFYGVTVAQTDPDMDTVMYAIMLDQNPLYVDVNNIVPVTYSVNVPPTTAAAAVLGEQEANTSGSLSAHGVLSSTGAKVLTLAIIALVLVGCGVAMVMATRKKESVDQQ